MPVSRDIDCYSLAKISEILTGANILSTPIFVTFSARQAGTISQYSAGESPPIKAGRPEATAHLVTARGGIKNYMDVRHVTGTGSGLLGGIPRVVG